jgi:hypothetical protein
VTVSVALDVGAPVMVAALGNRNEIVKVFGAVRRSRVDELRQHGHDALERSTPRSYDSLSSSSSSFMTSRCAAHSIAEPRAIV